MMQIEIDRLSKHFGTVQVLRDVTVSIPNGAFVALVGPSGCGKSTLLRTIAGLEKASSGVIRIAGELVNNKPPRERDVAMVFQSYALYPHMSVENNMNYSMRLRKRARAEILERTTAAAKTLGLLPLLDRFPRQLSGGQRQRVAMGRAIVRNPKVFLFDEPLSNLDAALRVHMRNEIRRLHERLEATSVYVTHDQVEAMTMADHIVVMRAGVVEQQGSPLDLYDKPANRFVAGFIGSPAMNFLEATVEPDGQSVRLEGTPQVLGLATAHEPGRGLIAGLRPEHLKIEAFAGAQKLTGLIEGIESTGSMTWLEVAVGATLLIISHSGRLSIGKGDSIDLYIAPADVHLFDRDTDKAI